MSQAYSTSAQEYELFAERAIEDYKDSVSRAALLRIGDEAVARLSHKPSGVLREVEIWQEVDRIILDRLHLPSFEQWRLENGLSEERISTLLDALGEPIRSDAPSASLTVVVTNTMSELVAALGRQPKDLHGLTGRQFELLVAELLSREGFEVEVTPATRDGGKDVIARLRTSAGSFVVFVECKRYAPGHPVGVSVARELVGVVHSERATSGLLVTTSSFTKPVVQLKESMPHRLNLRAYADLVEWLNRARTA